jgi:hypothetical protein
MVLVSQIEIWGCTSPAGWCRMCGAESAAPPVPAMMSPEGASSWICRMPSCTAWLGFEAAMWRRTAARLRNRQWLDSLPVEVQGAHTKRVTRPSPSVSWTGPAAAATGTEAMTANATAASKNVSTADIIAYRTTCTVFVELHERPRILILFVLRCTLSCHVRTNNN